MMAALLAATAGTAGLAGAALAQQGGAMHAMHGGSGHAMMDPAEMGVQFDRHIAEMVPDATDEQKTRLKALAASFHTELGAFHSQLRDAHGRAHALLLGPNVDRAGLERLRVEQIRALDETSRRLFATLADAAEVLTPEQRQRIAAAHAH